MWLNGRVLRGDQTGRTIGFPTINLDPSIIEKNIDELEKGVYAARVRIEGKEFKGALYYGPRIVKGETHDVLEINILDFDEDVYDEKIEFEIVEFIRQVMGFDSLEKLQEQIQKDIASVRYSLSTIG
jgi:riboflavin kinase/FMN adenylyltransferase